MDWQEEIQWFHQGQWVRAYRYFGAHLQESDGCWFRVYAPHARSVSVIGSFNEWNPYRHFMTRTPFAGIWETFIEGVKQWDSYKYHIVTGNGNEIDKADPYAFYSETRPSTASKVYDLAKIHFTDEAWMENRMRNFSSPMSIYEVYAGGWKKNGDYPYTYMMLKDNLISYVKQQGFTHVELMPLNEYPFDGSWGYQANGYFSCTSRYGNPGEFAEFVNACHNEGIGVIVDMVPVHFVKDDHGLRLFDGQPLYEYQRLEDAQSQWGTLNFNLWSEEVRSFLMSAAMFWLDVYHIDGLRLDAVSNIIYWQGNSNRGINDGALDFVKRFNYQIHANYPSVMCIAEDSSDFPMVTADTVDGGLGFDYKWDLGWMNDTLAYYSLDTLYRNDHHHKITFSMHYYASERFLLSLSHDENVHGKKTIVDRMFGNYEQKFSQARNLYAYMFAHPGKKLNFMGNEIASFREFDEQKPLDWFLLRYPMHDSFHVFFQDLNHLYTSHPCLYERDYTEDGFQWIEANNAQQSVYSFLRKSEKEILICIMNCREVSYENYDIPVPLEGHYQEILNTEDSKYSGCGNNNPNEILANQNTNNPFFPYKVTITLASYACVWLLKTIA